MKFNIIKKYNGTAISSKELLKTETADYYVSRFNHLEFKNKIIIFIVTYHHLDAIESCMSCVMDLLEVNPDVYVVVLDNNSDKKIQTYLKSLKHARLDLNFINKNIGKALAVNNYGQKYINKNNLPKAVVSIDPDIIFKIDDFNRMIEAVTNIKKVGMLGMRYKKNNCNPEMNLFFPSRSYKGINNKRYKIKKPFMCTVAGPIFAVNSYVYFTELKNRLFPKKFIATYGGDDSATYSALRWKYLNGYLENTEVIHLRSGKKVAEELLG
ncbi:MAG: hypothetical protein A2Y40_04255 [Candidatus Margulisbacteria bacterium GWF2_35_9]|nr:MAG: hypothetical protein A2Y40_04255 [Candidatus Margulisbacteria bacterium GWF2_35_9]